MIIQKMYLRIQILLQAHIEHAGMVLEPPILFQSWKLIDDALTVMCLA